MVVCRLYSLQSCLHLTCHQEFATHILFSSPCLHFPLVQKKALLTWEKTLGMSDIPSLYAMKKKQDQISKLLGSPTERVTSPSGNMFYLNSISKAIALDFTNLLTQFTMQDYPKDGQGQMSQIHHGFKMLEGLPTAWRTRILTLPDYLTFPCFHVKRNIFFVNKLLQQASKQYFILKKFFYAKLGPTSETEVLTLGHKASQTEMCFSVDPEIGISPISTFYCMSALVPLACKRKNLMTMFLTDSPASHAKLMPNPLHTKSGGLLRLCSSGLSRVIRGAEWTLGSMYVLHPCQVQSGIYRGVKWQSGME
ncbi:hypothetical protein PAXRUDRAFT_165006 [Paxillus rubicundulus Ve08.2h10]|uniref:Uncharacterized protein n=1 Tax=Paxillus rubicundulus Ve08.2h10 TaxID=930991 RepID=A0A0D0C4L6_9AGAM|nr:hypothetical protein PAXRUDRAFT_165006 [Paxillus rubicundulus Ve08.2h10]